MIFNHRCNGFNDSVDQGDHSLRGRMVRAHLRSKLRYKRIAAVFQVELEPLGREMVAHPSAGCSSLQTTGASSQQENSADPAPGVTCDPEALLVASYEKCRDRLADDAGIERHESSSDDCGLRDGQDGRAFALCAFAAVEQLGVWRGERSGLVSRMAIIARLPITMAMAASLRI